LIRTKSKPNIEKTVKIIALAAAAKQAGDLKVLDIRKTSCLFDFFIIGSAESTPQLQAITKEVDKALRSNNIKGFRWQGVSSSGWLVLDLGNIVIHLMGTKEREYYRLEELWEKEAIIYHY